MSFFRLAQTHSRIARRQKALWFTAIPLAAFATLLAIISPGRPNTGSIEDLAFSAQFIAMFTGIAYAAAFADFFTSPGKLGIDELELSTPVAPLTLRFSRVIGALSVIVAPSVVILLVMGLIQMLSGNSWAVVEACEIAATVVIPAALIALALSSCLGAILPRVLGRIVAVLVWFYLIFTNQYMPIPTPNGTIFSVTGDPIVQGYFGQEPIFPVAHGLFAFTGTWTSATISLLVQAFFILSLLVAGSCAADRQRKR